MALVHLAVSFSSHLAQRMVPLSVTSLSSAACTATTRATSTDRTRTLARIDFMNGLLGKRTIPAWDSLTQRYALSRALLHSKTIAASPLRSNRQSEKAPSRGILGCGTREVA